MSKTFVLGIITLMTTVSFAYCDDPNYKDLVGTWETDVPKNDSHYAEITAAKDGEAGPFVWSNKAGQRWPCSAGHIQPPNNGPRTYTITFGEKSPNPGHVLHLLRGSDGKLVFLREHTKDSGKEVQNWVMRRKSGDRYEGLAGSYKEKSGGEMLIRKADDTKKEAGPWRFVLKGNGDWACNEGQDNPGGGKPTVYFIEFAEGPFKGQRYDIVRDKDGKLKELQLVGGSKAIWVRQ
jgi:hypothetical protein